MATGSSQSARIELRRAAVREEALAQAMALMSDEGVGALSISEVARRMGIRGPSLYKYFPSRHAVYDALFARALVAEQAAVDTAIEGVARGVPRLIAGGAAVVRWAVENPALAQLLHWRPVPGFEPSPEVFTTSVQSTVDVRAEFAEAVRLSQLAPTADGDEAVRLWTVVLSGLITQQMANEPGRPYAEGAFSQLTETALEQFLSAYRP